MEIAEKEYLVIVQMKFMKKRKYFNLATLLYGNDKHFYRSYEQAKSDIKEYIHNCNSNTDESMHIKDWCIKVRTATPWVKINISENDL